MGDNNIQANIVCEITSSWNICPYVDGHLLQMISDNNMHGNLAFENNIFLEHISVCEDVMNIFQ